MRSDKKIKLMYISDNASEGLDSRHVQNIMTESEYWVI